MNSIEMRAEKTSFLNKATPALKKIGTKALAVVGIVAIVVMAGQYFIKSIKDQFAPATETHEVTVTNVILQNKLSEIGELATYEYSYTDQTTKEDTRQLPVIGVNIVGTTHEIEMIYDGIIKVGYQVNQIDASLNEANGTIYVKLPKPEVLGNYIDFNTLVIHEDNNILNPIKASELQELITMETERQLQEATDQGLYEKAADSVKDIIRNLYRDFNYNIIFSENTGMK